jgi:hypothetical protein
MMRKKAHKDKKERIHIILTRITFLQMVQKKDQALVVITPHP